MLDERQAATFVTSCVVLLENAASALNWVVAPMAGAAPASETAATVGGPDAVVMVTCSLPVTFW